jgi:hypothetical protein
MDELAEAVNTVTGIPKVALETMKGPILVIVGKQYTYVINITLEVTLFVLF